LFEGGFEVFDDFLGENIGEIVGLFEALAPSQKMSRLASSFYCEKTPRARNMKSN